MLLPAESAESPTTRVHGTVAFISFFVGCCVLAEIFVELVSLQVRKMPPLAPQTGPSYASVAFEATDVLNEALQRRVNDQIISYQSRACNTPPFG